MKKFEKIKKAFGLDGQITETVLLSDGGIHETYQIWTDAGKNYIFQRMNTNVFSDPGAVMRNIALVTEYLHQHFPDMITLHFYQTGKQKYLYENWRVMDFIDGYTMKNYDYLYQSHEAGCSFGEFQKCVSGMDSSALIPVIPEFHHTSYYYQKFLTLADDSEESRILKSWEEQACSVITAYQKENIPLTVTHNDMKCSNLLFHNESHLPVAVIDLDTVMPGMAVYDFGDAARSVASNTDSGNPDLSQVGIDMEKFRALSSGWLHEMQYEEPERKLLIPAVFAVTAELAVRYMTDYLQGNIYFKVGYPEQNLVRAKNQIRLAQDILNHQKEMEEIICE